MLYKIYDGKISKTMDFGAFVSLEGVKGRREGLVHVSQLTVRVGGGQGRGSHTYIYLVYWQGVKPSRSGA